MTVNLKEINQANWPPLAIMRGNEIWKLVVHADECKPCDMCEEPVCYICDEHYADCDCPGPTQDGIEYEEFDGTLYGRPEPEQLKRRETDV